MATRDFTTYAEHTGTAPDGSSRFAVHNLTLGDLAALDAALQFRIDRLGDQGDLPGVKQMLQRYERLRAVVAGTITTNPAPDESRAPNPAG